MRKAPIISVKELMDRLEPLFIVEEHTDGFPYKMPVTLSKDLAKVNFDWENWEKGGDSQGFTGYKTLSNNLPVLVMWAGGDWQFPVAFILYWDGRKVRGYIPTEGNVFNRKTKEAYDNDDAEDMDFNWDEMEKDIIKRIQLT